MKKSISLLTAMIMVAIAIVIMPATALAGDYNMISSTSQVDSKTGKFTEVEKMTLYPEMGKCYIYFSFPSSRTESATISLKQKGGSKSYDISEDTYVSGYYGYFSGDLSKVAAGEYYVEGTYRYIYSYTTIYVNGRPTTQYANYSSEDFKSKETITIKKGVYGASSSSGSSSSGSSSSSSSGSSISGSAGTAGTAKQNGWVQSGSKWYYGQSGKYVTGWKNVSGKWYIFDSKGAMQTGWQKIDGQWYYMASSGAMLTGWQKIGGTWYYLQSSGAMKTGWLNSGGTWYYLRSSGAMATGWEKVSGIWYYLQSSGAMQTGWLNSGGTWYYLKGSGAMATGWLQLGSTWYYLNGSGAMVTGTQSIGGKTYRFASSGAWIG